MNKTGRFLLVVGLAVAFTIASTLNLFAQDATPTTPAAADTYETVACDTLVASGLTDDDLDYTPFSDLATEGTDYECGYLTVPELHSEPDGKTIQVGVAILKSLSSDPAAPLLMFQGGPGGSSIDIFPYLFGDPDNEQAQLLRGDRDLIIFEKRGNRYSQPWLTCAVDANEADSEEDLAFVQPCRDRLVAEGINLAAFNSVESARDVATLVNALGYETVDLYGVSYGTELVQTIMRLHPEIIRSVILDGIVPPEPSLDSQYAVILDRLINDVDAACAADADCDALYPDVKETFVAAYERLNQSPATIKVLNSISLGATGSETESTTQQIDGEDFAEALFQMAYSAGAPFIMPTMIYRVNDGEYELIQQYAYLLTLFSDDGAADGTYFSVKCSEDMAYADSVVTDGVSPTAAAWGEQQFQYMVEACQIWDVPAIDAAMREPVVSDIPALLLNGEFDPITPPPYGEIVAAGLSNHTFVVFPANGHGAIGTPCSAQIMAEFLNDPDQTLDTSCASADQITFVTEANTLIAPGTSWLARSLIDLNFTTIVRRVGLLFIFMVFPLWWLGLRHKDKKKHPDRYPMNLPAPAQWAVWLGVLLGGLSFLWIVLQIIQVGFTFMLGGHGELGYTQLFVGVDRRFAWIYVLPILIALTSVAMLVMAFLSWKDGYWNKGRRVYYSTIAGMAIAYTLYLASAGQLTVFLSS